jgi:UDPglucose 6-dehydrogenase
MDVVKAADEVNDRQKLVLFDKIKSHFGELKGKTIAIWGLAFKPRTDDVREAPSLYIIEKLTQAGALVKAYDPVAAHTAREASKAPFEIVSDAITAVKGADALAIVTEWNEFRSPDLAQLKTLLRQPVIFDGRNVLDPDKAARAGFSYYCIGRQAIATQIAPSPTASAHGSAHV